MNHLLLVTIILALFSPRIYAQNYTPKFDEGLKLAEFLEIATGDSSLQVCLPFPPIKFETIKDASIKVEGLLGLRKELLKLIAGSYYGALRPYVADNKTFLYATKFIPPLQASQDPVAKEFLIQWVNINSSRDYLLNTASNLESQDSVLYAEGEQIDKNTAALKQEQVEFKAAVDAWNKKCVGLPANTYCTNEYNRLQAWGKKLGDKIDAHNKHVVEWKGLVNALGTSVSKWADEVKSWEQVILGFIEKVEAFLRDTGTCTQAEWDPLQQAVHDYCHGVVSSCKQWNQAEPAKDCSTWREYLARNQVCRDARHNINTTCYGGGNPVHKKKENEAIEAMFKCQDFITDHCTKSGEAIIPGRRYGLGF